MFVFFWHVSHIIIPAVCYSWNIWGGYRSFSWWVSKHFAEEFSIVICALYRGMKWPAWCRAGGQRQTRTRNPQLPSPHFHAPNACLRYLLQREVPKRAAVSCCLHRNLANRACLGQQVSHISTISSSLGARGGLCREGLLTGAGRNTFKGVLNQQGLVWLFPCTVLFEHVAV